MNRNLLITACVTAFLASATWVEAAPQQAWAEKSGLLHLEPNRAMNSLSALDRLTIQELFARWGIAYDEARLDVISSLFTADAVFQVHLAGTTPLASAVGRDAIVLNVTKSIEQQGDQRRHAISNILIDRVTKNTASAIAYGVVVVAADRLYIGATVIYSATLRRAPDGVWRFTKLTIAMDAYAGNPPQIGGAGEPAK